MYEHHGTSKIPNVYTMLLILSRMFQSVHPYFFFFFLDFHGKFVHLRASMGQDLAFFSIEREELDRIYFDDVIEQVATSKSRKQNILL